MTPFGTTLAIIGTFQANCQFQGELTWNRLAFNPVKRDNTWAQSPKPRNDTAKQRAVEVTAATVKRLLVTSSNGTVERTFRDLPCCPVSTANGPVLRGTVFLDSLDTLLSWADQLVRESTLETTQQALVLLETMDHLLCSSYNSKRSCRPLFRFHDVARSRQVCIYVVEAPLVAIYLPEGKDIYIHTRPALLPETTSFSCLYTSEPSATSEPATSRRVATETRPIRNT